MPYKDPVKRKEHDKEYGKKWRSLNPEKQRERSRRWRINNPERVKELWRLDHAKHRVEERAYSIQFREKHPEYYRDYYLNRRKKGLEIIGKGVLECVNCKCSDIRLLEIHHKERNGTRLKEYGTNFVSKIVHGERAIDDLELRCRICNALDSHEAKYGVLPYQIIWNVKP